MPNLEITPRERSALRAAAHSLHPVVLIGDRGLTDAVIQEIDRNLNAHGLIKVRAGGEDRESREEIIASICEQLSCALVHHLGKMLILYRPALEKAEPARQREPDVYIPKKQAAAGRSTPKPVTRRVIETVAEKPARRNPFDTDRSTRPTLHKGKPGSGRGKPGASLGGSVKRGGSSLSLRAGARRGRS